AIYCNINCFGTVRRFATDIVHILDLNGPVQFEGVLAESKDYERAMTDGRVLEMACRSIVERLRQVDYLITVSERQKYFWLAYSSLAGFSLRDLNVILCPVAAGLPALSRSPAPQFAMVYSGWFYPWQKPDRPLRLAAEILDEI